jgi:hypothetical protein
VNFCVLYFHLEPTFRAENASKVLNHFSISNEVKKILLLCASLGATKQVILSQTDFIAGAQ